MKIKSVGLSDLSGLWPADPYNLPHLCSGIYKVLLLFLRNATETFLWNTENIFAC